MTQSGKKVDAEKGIALLGGSRLREPLAANRKTRGFGVYAEPEFIRLSQAAEAAGQSVISTDGYAVLEFTHDGEEFSVWLTAYSLPALERVLGMSADPAKEESI